jgi:hypothetical protein
MNATLVLMNAILAYMYTLCVLLFALSAHATAGRGGR